MKKSEKVGQTPNFSKKSVQSCLKGYFKVLYMKLALYKMIWLAKLQIIMHDTPGKKIDRMLSRFKSKNHSEKRMYNMKLLSIIIFMTTVEYNTYR